VIGYSDLFGSADVGMSEPPLLSSGDGGVSNKDVYMGGDKGRDSDSEEILDYDDS